MLRGFIFWEANKDAVANDGSSMRVNAYGAPSIADAITADAQRMLLANTIFPVIVASYSG